MALVGCFFSFTQIQAQGMLKSSGTLPNVSVFDSQGNALKLKELCQGKYTVLASGCLTCPEFHKSYKEVEAANHDFKSKGVQFYYVYKSLRHPELGGYVEAQNMSERLLQLAEAQRQLGTKVPWLADTLDDALRISLGANSQSVYLISPQGDIVYAQGNTRRDDLRQALIKAVGEPQTVTEVADLTLPTIQRPSRLINEDSNLGVKRPEGLTILKITPTKPDDTYYVKLRAEADDSLLTTGTGRLFIGFYPDPIHDAHWNNLTPPMQYTITSPTGVVVNPKTATAVIGEGDSDTLPRQFWIDISADEPFDSLDLQLNYYGCTPDLCMALSHQYTVFIKNEDRGARTYGMNKGQKGKNGKGGKDSKRDKNSKNKRGMPLSLDQMDADDDQKVSLEEMLIFYKKSQAEQGREFDEIAQQRVQKRFSRLDSNQDSFLSAQELVARE